MDYTSSTKLADSVKGKAPVCSVVEKDADTNLAGQEL
jgi:hypothetical protein